MVTDGILDAVNAEGERFGEHRLIELAEHAAHAQPTLAELARNIARGVYDYQAGELSDDASLLLLEYAGGEAVPPPATAPHPERDHAQYARRNPQATLHAYDAARLEGSIVVRR